jgi:hypothetical protein
VTPTTSDPPPVATVRMWEGGSQALSREHATRGEPVSNRYRTSGVASVSHPAEAMGLQPGNSGLGGLPGLDHGRRVGSSSATTSSDSCSRKPLETRAAWVVPWIGSEDDDQAARPVGPRGAGVRRWGEAGACGDSDLRHEPEGCHPICLPALRTVHISSPLPDSNRSPLPGREGVGRLPSTAGTYRLS